MSHKCHTGDSTGSMDQDDVTGFDIWVDFHLNILGRVVRATLKISHHKERDDTFCNVDQTDQIF